MPTQGLISGTEGEPVPPQRSSDAKPPPCSPAEAHALRRSAPLTHSEFKAYRSVVEQGTVPLRSILERAAREEPGQRIP